MIKVLMMFILLFGFTSNMTAGNVFLTESHKTTNESPFEGQYAGKFLAKLYDGGEQTGKLTMSISDDGEVTGRFENFTTGNVGVLRGYIDEEGEFNGTVRFPVNSGTLKGYLKRTKNNHLKGVLSQSQGNYSVASLEIDLIAK